MADQKDFRDFPRPLEVDFYLPGSKKDIFPEFLMKISHFWSIFTGLQGGPLIPEISFSNKSGKIYLYGGALKNRLHLTPQILDPKT